MVRQLADGEMVSIQPQGIHGFTRQRIKVLAHRVDCDTPFVILKCKNDNGIWEEMHFTDYEARDVALMFTKALERLPSSK